MTSLGTNSGSAPAGCWAPPPTVFNPALTTTTQNNVQKLRVMHTFPQRGGLRLSFFGNSSKCRLAPIRRQFIPRSRVLMAQQCTEIPAPEVLAPDLDTLTFVISLA